MTEIPFLPSPMALPGANIKVVGVGGAGCNAINRMVESGVAGVQFIALNTDQQSLSHSKAHVSLPLGPMSSRGLGAGGNPERGAVAAEESRDEILAALQGADMVFITAGLGGGTGTGAAPVVATYARELGALTVGVVLTPFAWEGPRKGEKAMAGLSILRETADTVIVVSNEKLVAVCDPKASMTEAYRTADGVLIQGVRGIADLILRPGVVNLDFADVESVLKDGGEALIGTGQARGEEAVLEALERALACPLLERGTHGRARNVIVSLMSQADAASISAVQTAMNYLSERYHGQAEIKLGQVVAPELEDRVLVTVLASGFDMDDDPVPASRASMALQEPPLPPHHGPSGRIYGDAATPNAEIHPVTPTRLLPQPSTPNGDMGNANDDLHVPAIIRLSQGRLPIE